ncbi:MAG TPA: GNAT family N-acetyltransferase [Cyclobacteriaceae bacterium]|nr:GNAT family N-acetyltransferase [Cyclobacteriaceae bacterium]HNU41168.1 GNAT family N-acetyltransferase [Cyclobacteriaceae bacterium]
MIRIVQATANDLPRLAACHRQAFSKALSSAMGQAYVEKMLEWYLVDDRAFIFLLEEDSQCVGYCGGLRFDASGRAGSASSMIQHSYNLAVKTFLKRPWLFVHPEFFSKYWLAIKNVHKRVKKLVGIKEKVSRVHSTEVNEPHTGLVVIGVDPRVQGKGYGSRLLQEFEKVSAAMHYQKMKLTVRTNNEQAIRSYLRNGWKTTKVDGPSTSMEKQLN